jgi:hypothetical protein
MPTLLELQRAVARSLLERDDSAVAPYVVEGIAAEERLAVYRNTIVGGLTTALRLSYPAVHRLVGAAFFESAAQIFIAAHPPTGACLDDYDPAFVDFLADFAPAKTLPYLAGVARLDWAVSRALHAADAPSLDPTRLAAIGADQFDDIRFTAHPSVSLVRANHPVDAIWRAVLAQDDAAMAAVDLGAGPVWLLVQRHVSEPTIRRLDKAAWRLTAGLCAGHSLQDALNDADDVDAPTLLSSHLIDGVFTDFAVDEPEPPEIHP